jgi:hypothetical protein
VLFFIGQVLRQAGEDYTEGRKKEESLKTEYLMLNKQKKLGNGNKKTTDRMYDILKELDIFWTAEEFWFDFDEFGESPADAFWEKWHLDWAGWSLDGFRRMVKEGKINKTAFHADKGRTDADNERAEQIQRVLDNIRNRKGGINRGSGEGSTSGVGSGDSESLGREAVALAGCVC